MAKKPTKVSVTQLQRDILAQRANLIRSEAEVAAEVQVVIARLLAKWKAAIRRVVTQGGTASEVADAARYAHVLRQLGEVTDAAVKQVEQVAAKAYQQTLREEAARFAHKLDQAGLKVAPSVGVSFDGIARKQLATASSWAEIPGLSTFKSFGSLAASAKRRMSQDVAEVIAEGKGSRELVRRWAAGRGAGRIATEADALARTALMAASNQAMVAESLASGGRIKALRWQATFDLRTCVSCSAMNGKVFALGSLPVMPRHFRCRCVWSPVFTDRELNEGLDKIMPNKSAQAPGTRDFDAWLRGRPVGQQLDFFGSELKRDAWARKFISLDQMSSPTGRVLPDSAILSRLTPQQRRLLGR